MSNRFVTNEELQCFINDYQSGSTPKEISKKYHRGDGTVISQLVKAGVYVKVTHRYTDEEINMIKEDYQNGDWESIMKKIPGVSKQSITSLMSSRKIKMKSHFWSEEEMKYLKYHYMTDSLDDLFNHYNGKYTKDAIQTKALKKFKYRKDDTWTENEDKILIDNYSYKPLSEVMKLLPNRSKNAIINHARKFNIFGYGKLSQQWTADEIKYIVDNWETTTDKQMAKDMKHTVRAVKCRRTELGFYRQNRGFKTYDCLNKFLRGQIQDWKTESMKRCSYQCVLTGSKDFEIHHLYPVNRIIEDIFKKYNLVQKENYQDYTQEEIDEILEKFKYEQSLHPYGVCVEKSLHTLFHHIYGKYNISEEQWNQFVNDFKNGVYNDYINEVT